MLYYAAQSNWDGSILHKEGINALMLNQKEDDTKTDADSKINAVSFRIFGKMKVDHEFLEFKNEKLYKKRKRQAKL